MKIAFHAMVQTLFSANIVFLCLLSRKEFMPKGTRVYNPDEQLNFFYKAFFKESITVVATQKGLPCRYW